MFKGKEKNDFSNIHLENLIFIKKLGTPSQFFLFICLGFGQFGSVFLVKNKGTNDFYALKCVAKTQILEQSLQKHLLV